MNMKRLLSLVAFFATLHASAQQVNPVPDYVFRNQMSVGRGTVTDTAAYFSIGPRYGANKGFMPPIVGDTATFSSGKRNGLLIFSVQKNKFLYWDSVRVQWSDMAGSSGTYITGTGITGYIPQFSGTTTIDTSALFTLGSRLGIGSSTFAYTSTNTANVELNGTAGGILGFKRNDSARGYLWHTGDNMELANTTAGAISFNTNSATRGSISSAGVWRLHNLAGTGDRVVVASSNGTLSASTSVTGLVDTTTISTRAWRQKGDDSLGAIIATKGSGTVTSVATGFGLSGGTITTTGTLLVDTLNIATRAWRQKGLDSLAALEVSGSGTTNYIPKFTAASTIGNSQIFDNGTNVGIGTTTPNTKTEIFGGDARVALSAVTTSTLRGYQIATGTTEFASVKAEAALGELRVTSGFTGFGGFTTFYNNGSERLRITSGGNVGIGISTPANNGAGETGVEIRGANYPMFTISTPTISQFSGVGLTSGYIGTSTNHPFTILTNSAERLRIFANGRVGVNTTTDAGYQFDINGTLRSVNGANFATTSGNVGIGTASPTEKLEVRNVNRDPTSAEFTMNVFATSAQAANFGGSIGLFGATDNAATVFASFAAIQGVKSNSTAGNTGGELRLFTRTAGGPMSERMRIDASGNVGIGTASPSAKLLVNTSGSEHVALGSLSSIPTGRTMILQTSTTGGTIETYQSTTASYLNTYINPNGGELNVATTTDAGDYKLQVSGNALVTAGKLDITTNTAFGLSVSRSGTSVVGGQINNSNGILYYGAESSTGGGLFTGSSAYAAVIGSGAAYPLQFATNNVTRATINTNGELLINTTTDNGDFKLQVNGNALISGSIKTANGGSSTAQPWYLGSVVATNVQLDTANYVEVEINGVFYRLAIVTPL